MTDQAGFDDREHLEAQLIDMHRLEGLGLLVGRIAHDFNNLLAVIGMNAEMVRSNVDDDSPLQARFDQIEEATRRAATLTLQMSRYCRGTGPGRGTLDVTRTIDDIAALLRVGIGDGTTLELDLADHPLLIEGNATEIQQVVVDLVLNGSEAIGRARGTVTVRARPTEPRRPPVETGDAGGASGAQRVDETGEAGGTGEEVLIEVSDDGPGIRPEDRAELFRAGFTTKEHGRGLGLAAVRGIVDDHHGTIEVDSEVGRGTRVSVRFPAASTRPTTTGPSTT